jgi:hypothetical protein
MKLIKNAKGKTVLKLSKSDWLKIGKQMKWAADEDLVDSWKWEQRESPYSDDSLRDEPESQSQSEATIEVTRPDFVPEDLWQKVFAKGTVDDCNNNEVLQVVDDLNDTIILAPVSSEQKYWSTRLRSNEWVDYVRCVEMMYQHIDFWGDNFPERFSG